MGILAPSAAYLAITIPPTCGPLHAYICSTPCRRAVEINRLHAQRAGIEATRARVAPVPITHLCHETGRERLAEFEAAFVSAYQELPSCTHPSAPATAADNPQHLYEHLRNQLRPTYSLVTAEQDEGLSSAQLQRLLDASDDKPDPFDDDLLDWESDRRWDATEYVLSDLLDPEQRAILEDSGHLDRLRDDIHSRDTSDGYLARLKVSSPALFRYDLDVYVAAGLHSDDEQRLATLAQLAAAIGLDPAEPATADAIGDVLDQAYYGGRAYVLWYDDPDNAYRLAHGAEARSPRIATAAARTVTFTGAYLAVIDHINGSGGDGPIPIATVQWVPGRVSVDAPHQGPGYSWHDIAMPSLHAYHASAVLALPTVRAATRDWPTCACGNEPDQDGFYAVDDHGCPIDSLPEVRVSPLLCCARPGCRLVFDVTIYDIHTRTFTVVGHVFGPQGHPDGPASPPTEQGPEPVARVASSNDADTPELASRGPVKDVDPDFVLARYRFLSQALRHDSDQCEDGDCVMCSHDNPGDLAFEIADVVDVLDEVMTLGGRLPAAWTRPVVRDELSRTTGIDTAASADADER